MKLTSSLLQSRPLAALSACVLVVSLRFGSALSAPPAGSSEPDFAAIDHFVESERQATRVARCADWHRSRRPDHPPRGLRPG